jgi:hypothetical protein
LLLTVSLLVGDKDGSYFEHLSGDMLGTYTAKITVQRDQM